MKLRVEVWRQAGPDTEGHFETHEVDGLEPHLSVLEMLDALNEQLIDAGQEPVAFESDCREGIGGACGISDPNMLDNEAEARKPPDVPFKRELQENQEGMRQPTTP